MIVRAPRPTERFTILNNDVINDGRMSFRALGVLVFVLSKPDNWRTDSVSLARTRVGDSAADKRAKAEGREAVRAALRELEACGYLTRVRVRDDDGTFGWVTTIYDEPQGVDKPGEKPQVTPTTASRAPVSRRRFSGAREHGGLVSTDSKNYEQVRPPVGKTVGDPSCDRCRGVGRLDDMAWCPCTPMPATWPGGMAPPLDPPSALRAVP